MGFWRRGNGDGRDDYAWAHDARLGEASDDELAGTVLLAQWRPGPQFNDGWHGSEPEGRWTTALAVFPVNAAAPWTQLRITCVNHHPAAQTVDFTLGTQTQRQVIEPREEHTVILLRCEAGERLTIACTPVKPSTYGADDERDLGIFVKSIELL